VSDRRLIVYGAAFALGLLVRSELLLALPLVLVHAALVGGRRAVVRVAVVPALLLAASLAINYASSRHLVVTTTGAGANLWIGNGPNADGVSPFVRADDPVVRQVERSAGDAVVADEMFRDHALRWITAHPARTGALALRKLAWTFSDRELPNASDIEWETGHSWLFRRPIFPLGLGVLLPLALVGLVALERRRRSLAALLAPVSVAVLVGLVFFTNARFRMTMIPSLAILAGVGIDRGLVRWRWSGGALAIGLALAWLPFGGVRTYRIPEIDVNTASLEIADGRYAEAVRLLRGALASRPEDASAWMALGTMLERMGRLGDADRAWADAERALPLEPAIVAQARAFRLAHPNTGNESGNP
jgi:hypothetical protein